MIIDLEKVSGLKIRYDTEKNKLYSKKAKIPKGKVRKIEEMKKVLLDAVGKPKKLYFMYRGVCYKEDRNIFRKYKISYDITIIPPNKLGREWVKTMGHYHPKAEGSEYSYPEVYEVLNGNATYLLQKEGKVRVVKAKAGEKVMIEPGYGHITINPTNKTLIMSNLVSSKFSSDYSGILKRGGGAYYGVVDKKGIRFMKNKSYKRTKLRHTKIKYYPKLRISKNVPLYISFVTNPEKFRFLNDPGIFLREVRR